VLAATADPWSHPFRITCADQPGDQIVGVISAGPDGVPDTADDIASWQLGRDVTDLVRGARWTIAQPKPTPARRPHPSAPSSATKVVTPPPAPKNPTGVQLDENGMPVAR
jgi:hypothetical protein